MPKVCGMSDTLDAVTILKVAAIVRLTNEFERRQGLGHAQAEHEAKQFWREIEDLAAQIEGSVQRDNAR